VVWRGPALSEVERGPRPRAPAICTSATLIPSADVPLITPATIMLPFLLEGLRPFAGKSRRDASATV
jgi:hypothetical protein